MPPPIIFHHFYSPKVQNFWELEPNRRICFFKEIAFSLAHFWPFWAKFRIFWPFLAKLSKNVPNLTIYLQKSRKKLEEFSQNQKRQNWPPKCPKTYPEPKMAPKMGEGGQIWLKCITGDLIMMIRDKNDIFERVENFHADLAWNYPVKCFKGARAQRAPVTFLRAITAPIGPEWRPVSDGRSNLILRAKLELPAPDPFAFHDTW